MRPAFLCPRCGAYVPNMGRHDRAAHRSIGPDGTARTAATCPVCAKPVAAILPHVRARHPEKVRAIRRKLDAGTLTTTPEAN